MNLTILYITASQVKVVFLILHMYLESIIINTALDVIISRKFVDFYEKSKRLRKMVWGSNSDIINTITTG